jgi:gag-polypeptide of LTR copia-type/Integrase core domain/Retrotransposon gag protein/GAG-pre-integrase domain
MPPKEDPTKKIGSISDVLDPSSPFFLHHSDNPGIILVPQLLTESNYPAWSRAMTMALSSKNKLGFVDGTIKKPETATLEYQMWERCNTTVLSWMWNSVSKELTNSVIYLNTAKEVWDDLKERYAPSNSVQIYQIKRSISSLSQGEVSVTAYYTSLKGFWDELCSIMPIPACTCGVSKQHAENQQLERVIQFLMGLNDSYSAIRSQILTMDPLPNLGKTYSLVLQEEKQRGIRMPMVQPLESAALAASSERQPNHSYGRGRGRGNNKGGRSMDRPRCDHCGMMGHIQDKCYKLHGYPDKSKEKPTAHHVAVPVETSSSAHNFSLTADQYSQLMSLLGNSSTQAVVNFAGMTQSNHLTDTNRWIIDSGASDHMTPIDHKLNQKQHANHHINMPNGATVYTTQMGKTRLGPNLELTNVLHVPSFSQNLMSVSKLTKANNCAAIFFPNFCVFQDLSTKKMIGMGEERDGLYYYKEYGKSVCLQSSSNRTLPLSTWHLRLGHPPEPRLKGLLHDVSISFFTKDDFCCSVCPLAKLTRKHFSLSEIKTTVPFELIHCDIWGGYSIPTHNGARYFLTIVDDFTRCTWVYLMKNKSETQSLLKMFHAMTQTQFSSKIKTIRSDNASELLSNEMQEFFHLNGIKHETTCVNTPQQNGVAERKHRHLLEIARSLRFQSGLPKIFWGECIMTATYLINRIPTKILNGSTPYEMLFHKKPSYTHLRVFGCLCYIHTHSLDKFEPRAKKCIFVGYPQGKKGYKVFDLENNKFIG